MIPGILASAQLNGGSAPIPPGDSWVVLAHLAAPVDGLFDLTGLDLTQYERIVILLSDLTVDTQNADVFLNVYIGGVLKIAGYRWRAETWSSSGSDNAATFVSGRAIALMGGTGSAWGLGNASTKSLSARLELSRPGSGRYTLVTMDGTVIGDTGAANRLTGMGHVESTGQVDGVCISGSFGDLTAGAVTIYGVPSTDRVPDPIAPAIRSLWVGAVT